MSVINRAIFGLRFAVIPFVVMPLTLLLIPLGYGNFPSLAYFILHLVSDELIRSREFWKTKVSSRYANIWFYSFFLQEVIAYVLLAMVLNSALFPGVRAGISSVYNGFGYEAFAAGSDFNTLNSVVGVVAFVITINYTITHVLVHQLKTFNWFLGYALLVTNCDSQFALSHIYGHHKLVGTSSDVNTAFRGENFYSYLLRVVPGQYSQAYQHEKKRSRAIRFPFSIFYNRVTLGVLLSAVWLLAIAWFVGLHAMLAFAAANFMAKIGVETVDYIQHYGLSRADGERIGEHHSWDGESLVSSMLMFNQNCHALHHVRPGLGYYDLVPLENAPKLPHGYLLMGALVLIPPLWFRKMDPLVEEWVVKNGGEPATQAGVLRSAVV